MSEKLVREAIKNLIETNAATLVSGLTKQGVAQTIKQISTSSLTPPNQYFFVNIWISDVTFRTRRGFGTTTALGPSEAAYEVNIELADYAVATHGEEAMYEEVDANFQLFGDRLVELIRENYEITHPTISTKYTLETEREVNKSNLSDIASNASEFHAMLYSKITFTILEACTDPENLYD